MAGDPARHRLVSGIGARDADADCVLDAEPAAARRVVDLDLRRLDAEQVARLPRPGEMVELASGDASGPDFFERPVLFGRPSLVQVEDPAPGRAFLVVAVASRQRDSEAGEVGLIRVAVDDLPVQRAEADAVRRPASRLAVDLPARADRVAVAGLEVRPRDAPVHLRRRELDDALVACLAVVVPERLAELLLELTRRGELLDDVRAADELALDEDLRDRRPAGESGELLAEARVGEDVDGGHGCAGVAQGAERSLRVAARGEARRPLHEERHGLGLDDLVDLIAQGHCGPFVLIRSSWIEPSASGAASAS